MLAYQEAQDSMNNPSIMRWCVKNDDKDIDKSY